MRHLTGREYLSIDIANQMGMDKLSWDARISWVNDHQSTLEDMTLSADKPYLYRKAVEALRDTDAGIPTGHPIGLDMTASGNQIMGILAGCFDTARSTNIIYTGKRVDLYSLITDHMKSKAKREDVKQAAMTVVYGSKKEPENIFGTGKTLNKFYKACHALIPGSMEVLEHIREEWVPYSDFHSWTLPDGFRVEIPVYQPQEFRVELDEFNHKTFKFRHYEIEGKKKGVSIVANVIHSIEAYTVRQLIRACNFEVFTIHDCFYTHPNNMQKLRENYLLILMDLADSDTLSDILNEISGRDLGFVKSSNNLSQAMADSEYFLS